MILNGTLSAQDDAPRTLYVEVTLASGTTYNERFLGQFETELSQYNITPVFVYDGEEDNFGRFWEQHAIHVQFTGLDDYQTLIVTPYTTLQLSASPSLSGAFDLATFANIGPDTAAFDSGVHLAVGMSLYVFEDCENTLSHFHKVNEQALPLDGEKRASLPFYEGTCAILQGDLAAAEQIYRSQLPGNPAQFRYRAALANNLAWVYVNTGREEEALDLMSFVLLTRVVEKVLSSDEAFWLPGVFVHRAQLYALTFDYDAALADMNAALEIAEKVRPGTYLAELRVMRGQIVLLTYEWDAVLADYNTALEIDPGYVDAYFYRGVLYYTWVKRDEALADFEHYLQVASDGRHADEAARYAESIRAELASING